LVVNDVDKDRPQREDFGKNRLLGHRRLGRRLAGPGLWKSPEHQLAHALARRYALGGG
jgi:hypothetical protein